MKAADIRSTFLSFFEAKGHTIVPSSPVVPGDDPTLLFTNAGMNQFKDVFLGFDTRPYRRAVTAQKCIRAGGKHNDLDNVGYTARHHTFFEMLGNFSFGDYFKADAIRYAWELLTTVFQLPADKLWVTVYAEDDEAYAIWHDGIGVPAERIVRIGDNKGARYASDNFWMMGDTGPCGPCTEIFYDHGPDIPGGPPGSPTEDGDRYIEIWNNVFMQYNRDAAGVLHRLPKPSVDTGMGLERLAAVLQNVHSNYEIDSFVTLIAAAKRAVDAAGGGDCDLDAPSLKVIADHIRACSFTVVDGIIPGNEGRGYVLRRITRRAIRHGYKLGARRPFFHTLVAALADDMGAAYPELARGAQRTTDVLRQEEERFFQTIANGMEMLESALFREVIGFLKKARQRAGEHVFVEERWLDDAWVGRFDPATSLVGSRSVVHLVVQDAPELQQVIERAIEAMKMLGQGLDAKLEVQVLRSGGEAELFREDGPRGTKALFLDRSFRQNHSEISDFSAVTIKPGEVQLSGDLAFKLHDTYGFPLDLTADVCRERGVAVDSVAFDAGMAKQRAQARAAGKFKMTQGLAYEGESTHFHGYETLVHERATVRAVYVDGTAAEAAHAGDDAVIVLDHTPFYAESGGQVGDLGELRNGTSRFLVEDTLKVQAAVVGHHGRVVEGTLRVGDVVDATVDAARRARTIRNHSATHLMHKALREVLGEHVQQKGSLVTPERTRFDFVHDAPLTDAQIARVEAIVNAEILANAPTQARTMPIAEAQQTGAMMLFGEKYGDVVRVLDIGSSRELCGGTHVQRTGDIGLFKIVAESGVAAGIRRVEAVTGDNALAYLQALEGTVQRLAGTLKAAPAEVPARLSQLIEQLRGLEKELASAKGKLAAAQGDDLLAKVVDVHGLKVLAARLEGADAKTLRDTLDRLKDKLRTAVIVLAAVDVSGRVQLAAGVTADTTEKVKAGELVAFVAAQVGGKGGGKPDLAMAGGTDASALPTALASVVGWVSARA